MKTMKKFASLALALALILSLSIPAFAAEEKGSITVDNPIAGQTYTAYKIFDVVYSADKSTYAYTIKGESQWFTTVQTYAEQEKSGLTLTPSAADANVYTVVAAGLSAPDFAAALKAAVADKTGVALAGADSVTVAGLDLGYYFVASTSGALCNLTTTDPTAIIHDKNDIVFTKTDDDESVEVGQVINYVVTGKVPDTTGFETYTYQITDTMSDGLTFNKDVKVYIDEVEQTEHVTITYKGEGNNLADNQYIVTIDVMKLQDKVNSKIELKYTATVNEKAVSNIENNEATLTYSNDPTDAFKTGTITEKETVYTAKIVIDKYAADNTELKLAGAEFVLYKEVAAAEGETAAKKYYKYDEDADKVSWVDSLGEATEVTTDEKGAAQFIGLEDGTYKLHETAAPAGYNLLTTDVDVVIKGDAATVEDLTSLTATSKVANNAGSILPETGGIGTTIFYTVGGILVAAAVVLLVTKKRMASN